MSFEILEQKIKNLSPNYLDELSAFIDYLQFKAASTQSKSPIKRKLGIAKGELWIVDKNSRMF